MACASARWSNAVCVRGPSTSCNLANQLGVQFDRDADGQFALGREGGHSARRIVHARDTTGEAILTALLARTAGAQRSHHGAARSHGHRPAHDRQIRRAQRRVRGLRVRSEDRRGEDHRRPGGDHRHRRRGQGLPLHLQPRRGDRRRGGDGLPGGRPGGEHGVLPVSPHLPLSPGGQVLPDQRGPARRGRHLAAARRIGLHAPLPRAARSRPPRHRGPGHRRRDEAHRRRPRRARHDPPAGRLPGRAFPQHPPPLSRAGHRHGERADPGGAGRPLQLWGRAGRRARTHQRAQPVRHRRGVDDRAARRLPAGLQLPARGPGLRRAGRRRRPRRRR